MERSILGIKKKDGLRATKIRVVTKCRNVVYMAKKLKMKYAGHLARMVEDWWCKMTTFWVPYGHIRRTGRPVTS